jgi:hypothetical protein
VIKILKIFGTSLPRTGPDEKTSKRSAEEDYPGIYSEKKKDDSTESHPDSAEIEAAMHRHESRHAN